jgi:hypothetical protein
MVGAPAAKLQDIQKELEEKGEADKWARLRTLALEKNWEQSV